jgi:hypothetical protein
MTLLGFVRRSDDDVPLFGVIADDSGARYVFPPGVEPKLDEERVQAVAEAMGAEPQSERDWYDIASSNLGLGLLVDDPMDDIEDPDDFANEYLHELYSEPVVPSPLMQNAASAFEQISRDYPDFADDPQSVPEEAMTNYVLNALGPIDPEGPNGWILRAVDGNPRDGDENEYVHFRAEVGSNSDQEDAE